MPFFKTERNAIPANAVLHLPYAKILDAKTRVANFSKLSAAQLRTMRVCGFFASMPGSSVRLSQHSAQRGRKSFPAPGWPWSLLRLQGLFAAKHAVGLAFLVFDQCGHSFFSGWEDASWALAAHVRPRNPFSQVLLEGCAVSCSHEGGLGLMPQVEYKRARTSKELVLLKTTRGHGLDTCKQLMILLPRLCQRQQLQPCHPSRLLRKPSFLLALSKFHPVKCIVVVARHAWTKVDRQNHSSCLTLPLLPRMTGPGRI